MNEAALSLLFLRCSIDGAPGGTNDQTQSDTKKSAGNSKTAVVSLPYTENPTKIVQCKGILRFSGTVLNYLLKITGII